MVDSIHELYAIAVAHCGPLFLFTCYIMYRVINLTGTTKTLYREVTDCNKKHAIAQAKLDYALERMNKIEAEGCDD